MRNNIITCVENSPIAQKYSKPKSLGINFISIMGYNVSVIQNVKSISYTI